MSICKVVNGDGEEHVEQRVVAKQGEHDEVEAGEDCDEDGDGDIDECSDDGGDGEY